jgi:hypothetical protein
MISNFLQILQSAGSPLNFCGLWDPLSVETIVMMLSMVFSVLISVLRASWNFFVFACLKKIAQKLFKECWFQGLGWSQILPNDSDFD